MWYIKVSVASLFNSWQISFSAYLFKCGSLSYERKKCSTLIVDPVLLCHSVFVLCLYLNVHMWSVSLVQCNKLKCSDFSPMHRWGRLTCLMVWPSCVLRRSRMSSSSTAMTLSSSHALPPSSTRWLCSLSLFPMPLCHVLWCNRSRLVVPATAIALWLNYCCRYSQSYRKWNVGWYQSSSQGLTCGCFGFDAYVRITV